MYIQSIRDVEYSCCLNMVCFRRAQDDCKEPLLLLDNLATESVPAKRGLARPRARVSGKAASFGGRYTGAGQ